MSNKIYKSKMKDENRLLGKFVNISLIALSIIFVLLFLKIIVTEISFHKMIAEMVEGIDYYIEDIVITDKETVEAIMVQNQVQRIISFTMDMILISGCK